MSYEKIMLELMVAILEGIYTHQFYYPYSNTAQSYKRYAESTIKMANEFIEGFDK